MLLSGNHAAVPVWVALAWLWCAPAADALLDEDPRRFSRGAW